MSDPKHALPVIAWYWRDWRASTARAVMSPLARGVYRELLDAHYGEEDCALPDDDKTLAALAGVDLETWMQVREQVVSWLPLNECGRRQNTRALASWREALSFRKSRRRAGKRGADVRWHSHSGANGTAKGRGMANDGPLSTLHSPLSRDKNPPTPQGVFGADFVEAWNEAAGARRCPRADGMTKARARALNARIADGLTLERFKKAAVLICEDPFLRGENENGKVYADFDYALSTKGPKWYERAAQSNGSGIDAARREEFGS